MPKESFFFVASDVVPILYNKSCFSKTLISSACARLIARNWDNI